VTGGRSDREASIGATQTTPFCRSVTRDQLSVIQAGRIGRRESEAAPEKLISDR
jgi:hypothetical protein